MIINSSNLKLGSERSYAQNTQLTSTTYMKQIGGAGKSVTSSSISFGTSTYQASLFKGLYDQAASNADSKEELSSLYNSLGATKSTSSSSIVKNDATSIHEEILRRIREYIEKIREQLMNFQQKSVVDNSNNSAYMFDALLGNSNTIDLTSSADTQGTYWQRVQEDSIEYSESESTTFDATGNIVTADGREIEINVSMSMSREFTSKLSSYSTDTVAILTDPLVINLNSNPVSLDDDATFNFDIDGDGNVEEVSMLNAGSGFLALDKDGNGTIDNGNELFGAKTGNGFSELAEYDEDGNGFIDENDSVYSKLKVWVKDSSGNDKLMDLKSADVGAIYLGSARTEFSLTDLATNDLNGMVRRTGMFLHEDGTAGTMQQIDLATA